MIMMKTIIAIMNIRTVTAAVTAADELPADKVAIGIDVVVAVEVIVDVISIMEEEDIKDSVFELLALFPLSEEKKDIFLQVKIISHPLFKIEVRK